MKLIIYKKLSSISNILLIALIILMSIIIIDLYTTTTSIKKYISNDAMIINKLGQIRGSMQRMSKLMIANKDYKNVQNFINKTFKQIDEYYLSQALIQKYQSKIDFVKTYNQLKQNWGILQNSYNKSTDEIIKISEKSWALADKMTTQAQKIAELKKEDLITRIRIINVIILLVVGIIIGIVYFLVKKGLEKDKITDKLTSLYNRYYLEEQLKYHILLSHRFKKPFSIIFLDIDHFKQINDTFGHEKGDLVLQELAILIKKEIRNTDLAFRYGGEEFLILLPETNLTDAIKIAERLRQKVQNHKFPISKQVTISLGVMEYNHTNDSKNINDLIQKVDAYLYKAKANGRNQVKHP